MKKTPFNPKDVIEGDDGFLYHVPTLESLDRASRLKHDTPAYRVLLDYRARASRQKVSA